MKKRFLIPTLSAQGPQLKALRILLLLPLVAAVQLAFSQNITRPNFSGPAGLQVNSYTGSLFYQRTDLQIPGPGLSLDMAFAYNSADRTKDDGYGYGWTFKYNLGYTSDSSGLTFRKGDGRRDKYVIHAIAYLAPKGVFDVLLQYAPGKFKLVTKDNTEYYFDDPGHKKLTSVKDRNGNTLTMAYADGHLISITDGSNRSVTFTWTNNRLSEVKSAAGNPARVITYQYNSAGCLAAVKNAGGYTTSYTYGPGRLMTAMTDWNGNTVNIAYNGNRAVSKLISCQSEKSISYNAGQRKTYLIEKNGDKNLITTYEFDAEGRLVNKEGNCCGFKTSYSYDANNNINRVIDANGNTSLYTYDAKGNPLTETDPAGKITRFTWDIILSKITVITDKNGNKTTLAYDGKGNLTSLTNALNQVIQYTYDSKGNRLTQKDARNFTTSYTYSQHGYPITMTAPDGGITKTSYDEWGNMTAVTDPNNHTTTYTYDILDRLLTMTNAANGVTKYTYDGNGNTLSITDPNNNSTRYVYDPHNNLIRETDALEHTTSMVYDAMNNLVSATDANGKTTGYVYDHLNRLTAEINPAGEAKQYSYDGNGNRVVVRYPGGNILYFQFDALNRVTGMTDKLGPIASYTYDANGNRLSATDGKGNAITYKYDVLSRLTSSADAIGSTTLYVYDANNNVVKETDRNGNNMVRTFDALDRLLTTTDALGAVTTRIYDVAGNLMSLTDAKGNTTAYKYDALDRNTEELFADNTKVLYTYDAIGNVVSRTDNKGQLIQFVYDKVNRPVLRQYPVYTDSLSYDATGHLISARNPYAQVSFTYDAADRLSSETLNGRITGYVYNVAAGIKKIIYPNGRIIERSFDGRDQLTGIKDGAGTLLAGFTYDAAGLITSRQFGNKTSGNIVYNSNKQATDLSYNPSRFVDLGLTYDKENNPLTTQFRHRAAQSEQFTYDKLNQLTGYNKGSNPSLFNYDAVGNRTSAQMNGQTASYTVNNMNGYSSISTGSPVNLLYDGNGNVTGDGTHTYTYDAENRIISVNNGAVATYQYDALGRRVQKIAGTDTTRYFYDGLQVIEELDGRNSVKASYVWGTWIDDIVSMQRNGQDYYFHTNTLGSVMAITDATGAVAERYEYDAFGKPTIYNKGYMVLTSSAIGNTHTFTGRQYEPETGLFYYRARHYDASQGRFLQRDPLGYVDGMGLYAYTNNNPISRLDPMGTDLWDDVMNVGAGFADEMTWGGTELLRGPDSQIDKCSWSYLFGKGLSIGVQLFSGVGILKLGAKQLLKIAARREARKLAERGAAKLASNGARLREHLRQLEKYGQKGYKDLENGRTRYYGPTRPPKTPGNMAGSRTVREWDPATGAKRTWHETIDHNGNVRIVRPETGGPKTHYMFDENGNFIKQW